MNEGRVFLDSFARDFQGMSEFMSFLGERDNNSNWLVTPSKGIKFHPIEKGTTEGDIYLKLFEMAGEGEVVEDTMENTRLMMAFGGKDFPVRSCAVKTILERARISGNALNKVSCSALTEILNYCMDVASGESLVKVADSKISAVHGGDPKDYAILNMKELFQKVSEFLASEYPGNTFVTAHFDHAMSMAIWSLDGQADQIMDAYRKEIITRGLKRMEFTPALKFITSDVGMSGANLYPILLAGGQRRIVPLGMPIKTLHKSGANMDYFEEQLKMVYSRFQMALDNQIKLMDVEIRHPCETLFRVLKRIGAPKAASYDILDQFKGINGPTPCSAYELFMYMSEIIFNAQAEGASGQRITQLEDIVATAISINWHDYDHSGDFTW